MSCFAYSYDDNIKMDEKDLYHYYINHNYNENMFNSDGTLNKNYNSLKSACVISQIFDDHWDLLSDEEKGIILKHRPNAEKEVRKIINCYNKNLGGSVYECPNCHEVMFLGYTCKSRLCTSCGNKYKMERVENVLETAINCNHRHVVFTIPECLRKYFFSPFEDMINILFQAVRDTIYSILNEKYVTTTNKKTNKKRKKLKANNTKYTPGFFPFLHTFGRDIKWNPHIHVLIAELKLTDNTYIKWEYFDYDALSKRFQFILLKLMKKHLGKSFEKEKNKMYKIYKNGFYVYAEKKKFKNFSDGVKYVTRYCGRPAISENRIKKYDGENVTYCYNDHKDNSYHEVTVTAIKFIKILLRHLIPFEFKTIRYYGFYRKKHKLHDKIVKLISNAKAKIRKSLLKYKMLILRCYNRNPYKCIKCNCDMKYMCELVT